MLFEIEIKKFKKFIELHLFSSHKQQNQQNRTEISVNKTIHIL